MHFTNFAVHHKKTSMKSAPQTARAVDPPIFFRHDWNVSKHPPFPWYNTIFFSAFGHISRSAHARYVHVCEMIILPARWRPNWKWSMRSFARRDFLATELNRPWGHSDLLPLATADGRGPPLRRPGPYADAAVVCYVCFFLIKSLLYAFKVEKAVSIHILLCDYWINTKF